MTKLVRKMSLRSFYIFNSKLCQREEDEEHKKILYYHPADIELNTKIKDVGLTEAIITFTGTFALNDESCKSLHTLHTLHIFLQPEKDFWMVMVINVPKEIRIKDGIDIAEYKGGEVHDKILIAVLRKCYNMFRLFAGTFEMNLANGEEIIDSSKNLREKLDLFFSKYLLSMRLPSCDVVDLLQSIHYVPLEKMLFLRVHNFIKIIQATFPAIKDTIFLYNEHIVCSNIDPVDLYSIHEYLISTVLPQVTQVDLATPTSRINCFDSNRNGSFLIGPEGSEFVHSTKAPKVYNQRMQAFYLVIYRTMNATLCFLIDGEEPSTDFFIELQSFMGPKLSNIASDIGESFAKTPSTTYVEKLQTITAGLTSENENVRPKFLFINEQSLMHISNIFTDRRHPKNMCIPGNIINLIADLHDVNPGSQAGEVLVKSTNDFWIVKKRCNWRQFYVIILNNKATLLDVTNEAKKIFEQEITNDVFF